MSKASAARRLAAAAAFGGGGLGLVGGSLYAVLHAEAKLARQRIGKTKTVPPDPSGLYGTHLPGSAISLAVLGDSGAAGYGAMAPEETFGAFLAAGLSDLAQRPVSLHSVARVGAQTSDLEGQIPRALAALPDVCAIIIGTNDVTHKVRPSQSVRSLQDAVESLRSAGTQVVVGTCPDLGTLRPVAPPLRQVARHWSRRLAAAQTIAIVEADGRSVSLGSILGPEFAASPSDMFGPDQFHPSPAGYKACAAAMLPTVAEAVGVVVDDTAEPEALRGEGVFSLDRAAAAAAESTGTEVSRAAVDGGEHGPRGRWVLIRHRRRHAIPEVGDVEPDPDNREDSDGSADGETTMRTK
ncbi:MAG: SGNH/GDSL hydrolase family protein [Nocardioidaceae bacterium]